MPAGLRPERRLHPAQIPVVSQRDNGASALIRRRSPEAPAAARRGPARRRLESPARPGQSPPIPAQTGADQDRPVTPESRGRFAVPRRSRRNPCTFAYSRCHGKRLRTTAGFPAVPRRSRRAFVRRFSPLKALQIRMFGWPGRVRRRRIRRVADHPRADPARAHRSFCGIDRFCRLHSSGSTRSSGHEMHGCSLGGCAGAIIASRARLRIGLERGGGAARCRPLCPSLPSRNGFR